MTNQMNELARLLFHVGQTVVIDNDGETFAGKTGIVRMVSDDGSVLSVGIPTTANGTMSTGIASKRCKIKFIRNTTKTI